MLPLLHAQTVTGYRHPSVLQFRNGGQSTDKCSKVDSHHGTSVDEHSKEDIHPSQVLVEEGHETHGSVTQWIGKHTGNGSTRRRRLMP
jgi:hypothetical protein